MYFIPRAREGSVSGRVETLWVSNRTEPATTEEKICLKLLFRRLRLTKTHYLPHTLHTSSMFYIVSCFLEFCSGKMMQILEIKFKVQNEESSRKPLFF